uniref:Origin recognition complex subunit 1 n=1 Tax=Eptatretus burgeri TaxID=7764 RepID=A0A8C4Q6Y4_EPTBU
MYVSGVPGTGKTATLCEVVRVLREGVCQGCVPEFRFVELNGLRLTEPRHAFSHVLKVLTGRKATPDHAASLLDEMFSQRGTHHEATLLLVDEGVTRLAFPPYSHKQLVQVLGARLEGLQAFQPDALALVARKVAALSGDARRALDICRRAAEIALNTSPRRQQRVEMAHMSRALDEMFSSPCILAVRQASWLQRAFLQALLAEFSHSGVEEATLLEVYPRLVSLCRLEGIAPPSMSRTYASCAALYACRLVLADTACRPWRLRLSGSRDDITFALRGAEGLKS